MSSHRLFILLAASMALLNATPSLSRPICKPHLSVKDVLVSKLRDLERAWTATVHVDASLCAEFSGRFEIRFVREKENAPEIEFSRTLRWQAGELGIGQTKVSVDLWVDEVVHNYEVYAAPCACRN